MDKVIKIEGFIQSEYNINIDKMFNIEYIQTLLNRIEDDKFNVISFYNKIVEICECKGEELYDFYNKLDDYKSFNGQDVPKWNDIKFENIKKKWNYLAKYINNKFPQLNTRFKKE